METYRKPIFTTDLSFSKTASSSLFLPKVRFWSVQNSLQNVDLLLSWEERFGSDSRVSPPFR